jgi:O-antigen ligase
MFSILLTLIFARPFISSLAFPYLNYIYSYLLLLFIIAWRISRKAIPFKTSPLLYPLAAFFLALIVSVVFSHDKVNCLKESYKYITGPLVLLAAGSCDKKEKNIILRTLLFAGLAISILAIYQYFFGFRNLLDYLKRENINNAFAMDYIARRRVFSPFVTPNALGGYLAMITPLVLIFKNRLLFALPILIALFLTGSLGAISSLALAVIIYLYLKSGHHKKILIYLLGILTILGLVFMFRNAPQKAHFQPAFSAVMRLNYWAETLRIIKLHPWTGVGIGNFNLEYSRYAHNSYLQIWTEMGILGIISILWLIFCACRDVVKRSLRGDDSDLVPLICILIFVIHNVVDFSFFLPEVSYIWWLIMGVTIGIPSRSDGFSA